jgi:hypothetical protein
MVGHMVKRDSHNACNPERDSEKVNFAASMWDLLGSYEERKISMSLIGFVHGYLARQTNKTI